MKICLSRVNESQQACCRSSVHNQDANSSELRTPNKRTIPSRGIEGQKGQKQYDIIRKDGASRNAKLRLTSADGLVLVASGETSGESLSKVQISCDKTKGRQGSGMKQTRYNALLLWYLHMYGRQTWKAFVGDSSDDG